MKYIVQCQGLIQTPKVSDRPGPLPFLLAYDSYSSVLARNLQVSPFQSNWEILNATWFLPGFLVPP